MSWPQVIWVWSRGGKQVWFGLVFWIGFKLAEGCLGEGAGPMNEGDVVRVESVSTGVAGIVVTSTGGLTRCVSITDASLSLSLSLLVGVQLSKG